MSPTLEAFQIRKKRIRTREETVYSLELLFIFCRFSLSEPTGHSELLGGPGGAEIQNLNCMRTLES